MLSPDFLAYARTWTTCTYGVCQRKPCTVLLNSMGGRGFVPSETVEVLMLSCRQPLRSASLLVVSFLWSNTTNRYFRYAACVSFCFSYLPHCLSSKTHLSAWDCFLQRSMFPVCLLFLTLPITRPIFSHCLQRYSPSGVCLALQAFVISACWRKDYSFHMYSTRL